MKSRSQHIVAFFTFTLVVLVGVTYWAQYYWTEEASAYEEEFLGLCRDFIDASSFASSCPSKVEIEDIRVEAEAEFFDHSSVCQLMITGSANQTLLIAVDTFPDKAAAGDRMISRMRNGVSKNGNNLVVEGEYGNLLGFGEASAIDQFYGTPALLLWNDRVYAEINPTGGGMCPNEELLELGRYVYTHMTDLWFER